MSDDFAADVDQHSFHRAESHPRHQSIGAIFDPSMSADEVSPSMNLESVSVFTVDSRQCRPDLPQSAKASAASAMPGGRGPGGQLVVGPRPVTAPPSDPGPPCDPRPAPGEQHDTQTARPLARPVAGLLRAPPPAAHSPQVGPSHRPRRPLLLRSHTHTAQLSARSAPAHTNSHWSEAGQAAAAGRMISIDRRCCHLTHASRTDNTATCRVTQRQ